jgi:hypothetical protein
MHVETARLVAQNLQNQDANQRSARGAQQAASVISSLQTAMRRRGSLQNLVVERSTFRIVFL